MSLFPVKWKETVEISPGHPMLAVWRCTLNDGQGGANMLVRDHDMIPGTALPNAEALQSWRAHVWDAYVASEQP